MSHSFEAAASLNEDGEALVDLLRVPEGGEPATLGFLDPAEAIVLAAELTEAAQGALQMAADLAAGRASREQAAKAARAKAAIPTSGWALEFMADGRGVFVAGVTDFSGMDWTFGKLGPDTRTWDSKAEADEWAAEHITDGSVAIAVDLAARSARWAIAIRDGGDCYLQRYRGLPGEPFFSQWADAGRSFETELQAAATLECLDADTWSDARVVPAPGPEVGW